MAKEEHRPTEENAPRRRGGGGGKPDEYCAAVEAGPRVRGRERAGRGACRLNFGEVEERERLNPNDNITHTR